MLTRNTESDKIEDRINAVKNYFIGGKNKLKVKDFDIHNLKYKEIEKAIENAINFLKEKEKNKRNPQSITNIDLNKNPKETKDLKTNLEKIMKYITENMNSSKNLIFKDSQELISKIIVTERELQKFDEYVDICNNVIDLSKNYVFKPRENLTEIKSKKSSIEENQDLITDVREIEKKFLSFLNFLKVTNHLYYLHDKLFFLYKIIYFFSKIFRRIKLIIIMLMLKKRKIKFLMRTIKQL